MTNAEALLIAISLRDVGISEDAIAEELVLEYGLSSDNAERVARQAFTS